MRALKQKLSPINLVLSMLVASGLAGCINPAPVVDNHYGDAVNAAKAAQIINPDAALSAAPPDGVGGKPADAALDRYHRSFERPPITPNVFTIGVGTGGGMSGGSASGGASGTSR